MGGFRLILRRASTSDIWAVRRLVTEASQWLRTKGTDQWAVPWPDEDSRDGRIMRAIEAGRTWIVWDDNRAAATLTASPNHHHIWPEENRRDVAVYIRRLVVSRRYARQRLGAQLLDWAGLHANRQYGAQWVRVDVWTTNTALHEYYVRQGFGFCGFCETIEGYPSAALFQKPVHQIKPLEDPLFREIPDTARGDRFTT
jgi:GNAT superfamily N-acetyltransferase